MRFASVSEDLNKFKRSQVKKIVDEIEDEEIRAEQEVNQRRLALREAMMLGKEFRNYEELKALNASKCRTGVGRAEEGGYDSFTMYRVLNHPELIFN